MVLVILLLVQLVQLCWSGKPLDYTPLLKYLDDDIIRDLTDPIEGRAQYLKDYIKMYNERLVDSRDMIQQDVYEAYIKALELQKIGGPQFLKINFDTEKLKSVYNWTDRDLNELNGEFETTTKIWKEVEAEFKPAEERFRIIHEALAKEKEEMEKNELERLAKLRKTEEEFASKVTVNIGTIGPTT